MPNSSDATGASAPPPAAVKKTSELKARILSSLVLGPAVLALVWLGGWPFRLLLAAAALIAMREWVVIVGGTARRPAVLPLALAAVAVSLAAAVAAGPLAGAGVALVLAAAVGWSAAGCDRGWMAAGLPYVAFGAVGLDWLRESPQGGLGLLLFVMLAVWATDIGAYAAGRTIGGPKLAPRLSPKKTWAGLLGGVAASALTGALVALAVGAARPGVAALIGAVLAVVAQAGDLFESAVKRRYGVKDSGTLIPGHGGLLDRIDGLLTAAAALALFHAAAGERIAWW